MRAGGVAGIHFEIAAQIEIARQTSAVDLRPGACKSQLLPSYRFRQCFQHKIGLLQLCAVIDQHIQIIKQKLVIILPPLGVRQFPLQVRVFTVHMHFRAEVLSVGTDERQTVRALGVQGKHLPVSLVFAVEPFALCIGLRSDQARHTRFAPFQVTVHHFLAQMLLVDQRLHRLGGTHLLDDMRHAFQDIVPLVRCRRIHHQDAVAIIKQKKRFQMFLLREPAQHPEAFAVIMRSSHTEKMQLHRIQILLQKLLAPDKFLDLCLRLPQIVAVAPSPEPRKNFRQDLRIVAVQNSQHVQTVLCRLARIADAVLIAHRFLIRVEDHRADLVLVRNMVVGDHAQTVQLLIEADDIRNGACSTQRVVRDDRRKRRSAGQFMTLFFRQRDFGKIIFELRARILVLTVDPVGMRRHLLRAEIQKRTERCIRLCRFLHDIQIRVSAGAARDHEALSVEIEQHIGLFLIPQVTENVIPVEIDE